MSTAAARTIADFQGYLDELSRPISPQRLEYIRAEAVACYDLMNYSAQVVDLDSPQMRQLDAVVARTSAQIRLVVLA